MTELDWLAEIHVTRHACDRARERLGWDSGADEIEGRVRADVRIALLCDRVADRRPDWTYRPGGSKARVSGCRYLWDEDATRCWIVHRQGRILSVVSLLAGYDQERAAAERRRLRAAP